MLKRRSVLAGIATLAVLAAPLAPPNLEEEFRAKADRIGLSVWIDRDIWPHGIVLSLKGDTLYTGDAVVLGLKRFDPTRKDIDDLETTFQSIRSVQFMRRV